MKSVMDQQQPQSQLFNEGEEEDYALIDEMNGISGYKLSWVVLKWLCLD